jgi:hypothetical protein
MAAINWGIAAVSIPVIARMGRIGEPMPAIAVSAWRAGEAG